MRRAFTLIEMMVVIAVLIVLVSAVVAIGGQVKSAGQRKATFATMKTCEGLMQEYLANYLSKDNPEPTPPPTATWPYGKPGPNWYNGNIWATVWNPPPPSAYVPTGDNTYPMTPTLKTSKQLPHYLNSDPINWVSAFQAVPEFKGKLESLPRGRDIEVWPDVDAAGGPNTPWYGRQRAKGEGTRTVILDAWGNPIRYVHSVADNLGNVNKNGFFISAGPDGKFFWSVLGDDRAKNDDLFSTDPQ
jgi:prepilin-type N-terminal cleavage/methylation domain-containing protein